MGDMLTIMSRISPRCSGCYQPPEREADLLFAHLAVMVSGIFQKICLKSSASRYLFRNTMLMDNQEILIHGW